MKELTFFWDRLENGDLRITDNSGGVRMANHHECQLILHIETVESKLEALQKEFSDLYVDHENCMDGRTREANARIEAENRLEALQKEFSVLYVDHENCMDGRTREADARVEAENRFGRAVKALEAIRDGIPGPVLHALDTLNGLKRMESDSMYERAVENRRDLFSELKEGLESIPVENQTTIKPGDLMAVTREFLKTAPSVENIVNAQMLCNCEAKEGEQHSDGCNTISRLVQIGALSE